MGVRVTRNQSNRSRTSSSDRTIFYLLKILKSIQLFLTLIGTPFYYLLTWLVFLLFRSLWIVGQLTIEYVAASFNFLNSLLTLGYKTKQQFKTVKPVKIVRPKFKHPQIKLTLPTISLPQLEFPQFSLPRIPSPVLIFLAIITPAAFLSIIVWFTLLKDLPKPGNLMTQEQAVTSKIYDRNGNLLYKIYRNENRTPVSLETIPQHVKDATIAIEDADFYSHPGFSIRGMTRAFYKNATQGELTGGSTITQQLIKNTLLTPEKTFTRKLKEIILSVQTELTFTKDEILGMYFNEVAYGGAAYGIEEASQLYFGKSVHQLDLSEAALLAGLPKAPTTYSPFGAHPELAKGRQLEVLDKMLEEGYITPEEKEKAGQEDLVYAPQRNDIKAPHFVMWIKQLLAEKYGEHAVEEGGLEIYTTLDLATQEMAEQVVRDEVEKIKRLRISDGAVLVTEPRTGAVLAMVGSKDYFDLKTQGNYNVTTAQRQPGSSIKPINYSYALENGLYTASSLISDSPITYHVAGSPPYTPRNYDNTFRGNVTLRTALGSSLNIPAVKVLASYGVRNMIEHAARMGITSWTDPKRYGLSLTLGGGEVRMVDMNVAYGTFANYGKRVDLQPISRIINYKGQELEVNNCVADPTPFLTQIFKKVHAAEAAEIDCAKQVLDPRTAFIITNILSDNSARTPVFGPRSLLVIPDHPEVAVKTGTTQNLRDNWAIGFTQNYVVSTWVGNKDNTPMAYVASGVTGATPIWHKVMSNLVSNEQPVSWLEPAGIVKTTICPKTGTLPCEGCGGKTEYFLPGTEPKKQCIPPKPEEENGDQKPAEVASQQRQIL